MSLLVNRPDVRGKLLVSYSEDQKKEMAPYKETSCLALTKLLETKLHNLEIKINKILRSPKRDGFADIVIDITISNNDELETLKKLLPTIDESIGVGKISLFIQTK